MGKALPIAHFRRLLAELTGALHLLEKSEAGCCGITLSQCHLMLEVARRSEGKCTLSEAATVLGLDLSTVSRVADGLVRRGLLRREVDHEDRRRMWLQLTDAGMELVKAINVEIDAYIGRILEQIPSEKQKVVLESLSLLVEATKKVKGGCCV